MEFTIKPLAKKAVMWHLITAAIVILLMMFFGVMMLLNQGELISISPELFYKIMTAHGTGMIGIASLGGLAIMWYFLSKYLPLNPKVLVANFIMFLLGVISILIGWYLWF
jgi:cytochrome c oxidase subunit I